MIRRHLSACVIASFAIAAGVLVWPATGWTAERQVPSASQSEASAIGKRFFEGDDVILKKSDGFAPKAKQFAKGASASGANQPRQLALIVILLSILGVATRLLWRRHLRAVSMVQGGPVDDEVRNN